MNNKAYVEFHDINEFGNPGFAYWEPETYLNVPEIGGIAYVRYEDGSEELWKVKERIVYLSRVELYCSFHTKLKEPTV